MQSDWLVCPHCATARGEFSVPAPPEALGVLPPTLDAVPPTPVAADLVPAPPAPPAPPSPTSAHKLNLDAQVAWQAKLQSGDFQKLPDMAAYFPVGTTHVNLPQVAGRALAAPVPGDLPATLRGALEPELAPVAPQAAAPLAEMLTSLLRMQAQMRKVEPAQVLQEWSQGEGSLTITVETSATGQPTAQVNLTSNLHATLGHLPFDIGSMSLREAGAEPIPGTRKSGCTVSTSVWLLLVAGAALYHFLR
jgi:hypothetical protein